MTVHSGDKRKLPESKEIYTITVTGEQRSVTAALYPTKDHKTDVSKKTLCFELKINYSFLWNCSRF